MDTTVMTSHSSDKNTTMTPAVVHVDDTPQAVYYIVATLMTIGAVVGTFFNGVALFIFARHKHLRTPTNAFIMALCGCDFFMCLIGMPIPAAYSWRQTRIESQAVCVFDAFVVYFFGLSQMYILAAISVDRYVVIVRPMASSSVTHRMASLAIGMCFLFGLFWTVMPLLGWNRYIHEGIGVACSLEFESGDPGATSYIVAIFIFVFLLPLLVMGFSYANIYRAIRNIARNSPWGTNSHIAQNNYRLEKKMLRTVVIMIGAFLISWTPYAAVSFLETLTTERTVSDVVETFPAIIAKCSALWNPLIYIATNTQFRRTFFAMCPCFETCLWSCAGDDDSGASETQLGPESRAPVDEAYGRAIQGSVKGVSDVGSKVQAMEAQQKRAGKTGVSHEAITLSTRMSLSPDKKSPSQICEGGGGGGREGRLLRPGGPNGTSGVSPPSHEEHI